MEKAKSHYSGKKQQLQESQDQVHELQCTLGVRENMVKAVTAEMKLLQVELDKARRSEKILSSKVTSLEAQVHTCKVTQGLRVGAQLSHIG